jgi:hypothetical protein
MPNNFGDTFVDSYKFGTKVAQDEQQHAQAVAMEEQKLAATKAMEAAKMEALNKQITIADQERADRAKYQYDTVYKERLQSAHNDYISVKGDPAFKAIPKTSAKQVMSMYDIGGISPDDEFVPKEQFAMVKARENLLWQLGMQDAREKAKEGKEDEFLQRMMKITKDANENARGLMKQETTPAIPPGIINKTYNDVKDNPWFAPAVTTAGQLLINPLFGLRHGVKLASDVLGAFSSGTPEETKYVTDESKLGSVMNKQTELLQIMELELANKKVNPKVVEMYLDPQKSTLIQMADSRLVKDKNGIPIDIGNTQGLGNATVGKIKDIIDEIRMRQLANQARDLGNQKSELQVQQLQEKVQ